MSAQLRKVGTVDVGPRCPADGTKLELRMLNLKALGIELPTEDGSVLAQLPMCPLCGAVYVQESEVVELKEPGT